MLFLAIELIPQGGASCVAAWLLQAVSREWDVTILCAMEPDFEGLNSHFGTHLVAEVFTILQLALPLRYLHKFDPDPYSLQRRAWAMRYVQKRAQKYDVVISTENEVDFGSPGIQYTHYPDLASSLATMGWADGKSETQRFFFMLRQRLSPWIFISRMRSTRVYNNLVVTNSNWTAALMRGVYETAPVVVYPPVYWASMTPPWPERRNTFVALGRLSPAKRLLESIEILSRVRAAGYEIEFEVIGEIDTVAGMSFVRKLVDRIAATGG